MKVILYFYDLQFKLLINFNIYIIHYLCYNLHHKPGIEKKIHKFYNDLRKGSKRIHSIHKNQVCININLLEVLYLLKDYMRSITKD